MDSEKNQLAEVMKLYYIEWEKKNTHEPHLSVLEYKKKMRAEELNEIESQIERSSAELSELEEKISETEQIKTDIEAVENIEVKPKLFSDKVVIAKSDYDNLTSLSKKYASRKSNEKELEQKIDELNKENANLSDVIRRKNVQINTANAFKQKYEKENSDLKAQLSALIKKCEHMTKFITQLNLIEQFERFIEELNKTKNNVLRHRSR